MPSKGITARRGGCEGVRQSANNSPLWFPPLFGGVLACATPKLVVPDLAQPCRGSAGGVYVEVSATQLLAIYCSVLARVCFVWSSSVEIFLSHRRKRQAPNWLPARRYNQTTPSLQVLASV